VNGYNHGRPSLGGVLEGFSTPILPTGTASEKLHQSSLTAIGYPAKGSTDRPIKAGHSAPVPKQKLIYGGTPSAASCTMPMPTIIAARLCIVIRFFGGRTGCFWDKSFQISEEMTIPCKAHRGREGRAVLQ
jgi:hypothetical protein